MFETKEDNSFWKEFGKSPEPFGSPQQKFYKFELVAKSRTYKFRNLMYNVIG